MPYLSKGNPYSVSGGRHYAIPKYVLEEKEHRAISTPKAPYLTISRAQPPVNVAAKAPRGTVSVTPPQDFRPTTGKIYSSGTLGSLGDLHSGGSIGKGDGTGSLGDDPVAPEPPSKPSNSSTSGWFVAGALGLVAYLMTRR